MSKYSQLRYRDVITYVVTYPFRRILTSDFYTNDSQNFRTAFFI